MQYKSDDFERFVAGEIKAKDIFELKFIHKEDLVFSLVFSFLLTSQADDDA